MFDPVKLEVEYIEWSNKNFGEVKYIDKSFKYAHQPLLGMIEEFGELLEAETYEEKFDAIGDIVIFMIDYCRCINISYFEIYSPNFYISEYFDILNSDIRSRIMKVLAKIAHHHLKFEQNIRKDENHSIEVYRLLVYLYYLLYRFSAANDIVFEECIQTTWGHVKQRNWKNDKVKEE